MKTRKYNLNAIAMGVALALGSISAAQAYPTNPSSAGINSLIAAEKGTTADPVYLPSFEDSELTGIAGVESALSLIAGAVHVDNTLCQGGTNALPKVHTLNVSAFGNIGSVVIDGGLNSGGTTLDVELTPAAWPSTAAQVDVFADATGNKLRGSRNDVNVFDYSGLHHWSNGNAIFNDSASFKLAYQNSTRVPYKEVSIKDYYKKLVPDETGATESWEFDWGLEKIIKGNYPVSKWTELSWFKRYDGGDGVIKVRKDLVRVGVNGACRIVFEGADSVHDGFNVQGTVRVYKTDI